MRTYVHICIYTNTYMYILGVVLSLVSQFKNYNSAFVRDIHVAALGKICRYNDVEKCVVLDRHGHPSQTNWHVVFIPGLW